MRLVRPLDKKVRRTRSFTAKDAELVVCAVAPFAVVVRAAGYAALAKRFVALAAVVSVFVAVRDAA